MMTSNTVHILLYDKFFSTSIVRPYPPVYSPIHIPRSHRCNLQEQTGLLSQAVQESPLHSKTRGSQTAVKELRKQEYFYPYTLLWSIHDTVFSTIEQ